MTKTITSAVGLNSPNRPADVKTVQALLNLVPANQGGPEVRLGEDGMFGGKTAHAISAFQLRQFGWADGVAAPGQNTLLRLNQLAGGGPDSDLVEAAQKIVATLEFVVRVPLVVPSSAPVLFIYKRPLHRVKTKLAVLRGEDAGFVRVAAVEILVLPAEFGGGAIVSGPGLVLIALMILVLVLRGRPAVLPKTEEAKELERELSILEQLTLRMQKEEAVKEKARVQADKTRIEECGNRKLGKISVGGDCDTKFALWLALTNKLLRQLTRIIAGDALRFPMLVKVVNDDLIEYAKLLKALEDCLKCNEP